MAPKPVAQSTSASSVLKSLFFARIHVVTGLYMWMFKQRISFDFPHQTEAGQSTIPVTKRRTSMARKACSSFWLSAVPRVSFCLSSLVTESRSERSSSSNLASGQNLGQTQSWFRPSQLPGARTVVRFSCHVHVFFPWFSFCFSLFFPFFGAPGNGLHLRGSFLCQIIVLLQGFLDLDVNPHLLFTNRSKHFGCQSLPKQWHFRGNSLYQDVQSVSGVGFKLGLFGLLFHAFLQLFEIRLSRFPQLDLGPHRNFHTTGAAHAAHQGHPAARTMLSFSSPLSVHWSRKALKSSKTVSLVHGQRSKCALSQPTLARPSQMASSLFALAHSPQNWSEVHLHFPELRCGDGWATNYYTWEGMKFLPRKMPPSAVCNSIIFHRHSSPF